MQTEHIPTTDVGASLTRRSLISIAATLPVVAFVDAEQGTIPPKRNEPSLDVQLDECVARLRAVLLAMHPHVSVLHPHYIESREDGTFRFSLQGDRDFSQYDNEGLYEVSNCGRLETYWLERDSHQNPVTGEPVPGCFFYWATPYLDGEPVGFERRSVSMNIVRKLEGGAL